MERNTCWPCYDIITFRNSTYDDYNVARLKTKKAEYTSASDLNSEVESTKRKRIINRLYVASDSDDNCDKNNNSTKQKQIKENEIVKKKRPEELYILKTLKTLKSLIAFFQNIRK
ncbi:pou class transcription factor 2-like protein [Lasius niger]|uniref:Pou class transcription factor 2-like protein n=1 Tax=Lasius niger TaxID=67767 RepID=A0A0J7KDC3_LASNI|nr:pou class transcription factor 2-like protein [Lasius niger]